MEDHVRFRCSINNFSAISKMYYSNIFYAGGYKWRILISPEDSTKYLSIYLNVADSETLPPGWTKYVHFYSLSIINQNPQLTVTSEKYDCVFDNGDRESRGFDIIRLRKLNDPTKGFLVGDVCTVEAEIRLNIEEQDKKENEKADQVRLNIEEQDKKENVKADQKAKFTETEAATSEFDTLFVDIQTILEGESFKADTFVSSLGPPAWTVEEIAYAKNIYKQCLEIDLDNVIQLGRDLELKKSLSILVSSKAFPENMVDEITKFVANFVQSCEQYEVAKQDLREVQEKEKSIDDQKTTMMQLSSKFVPIRKQAEGVDHEIAELERQLLERKAKKRRLGKMLRVLADQAATSKQSLVSEEEDHVKFCVLKKEEAGKVIGDMKRSWEALKLGYSLMLL